MTRLDGDFIDDQLIGLWFLGLYAIAAFLLAHQGWTARRRPYVIGALAALIGAVALSGVWSQVESRTFSQAIMFAGTAVFAIWIAERFSPRQIAWMVFAAMQVGATIGTWAVQRNWYQTLSRNGDWEGIYFNRNSFAPVAAMAIGAGVVVVVGEWGRLERREWAGLVGAMAVAFGIDVAVLINTNSVTPLVGLAAMSWTCVAWWALRRLRSRMDSEWALGGIFVGVSAALAVVALALRGPIADLLGRDVSFTRRRELWDVVLDWWSDQPVGGMGWQSVWLQDRFQVVVVEATGQRLPNAHNGYLEVLLGAGLIGAAALIAFVAITTRRNLRIAAYDRDPSSVVLPALLVYGLVVNTQEMFIGANLVVWTLIVVAAVHPAGDVDHR